MIGILVLLSQSNCKIPAVYMHIAAVGTLHLEVAIMLLDAPNKSGRHCLHGQELGFSFGFVHRHGLKRVGKQAPDSEGEVPHQ
jgi:hypothetical protein